ncbi:DegT/DnrJ/EryC1/StrS family aminotransferase [Umezawaea sp. NPDC059074]|uniref:DegT/DnrJ/EryC1/StrS family aminotransferase n=1 Tax=Umezawaea sp. NPDC059074 TaxID=3346716 RepID=UPI00367D7484
MIPLFKVAMSDRALDRVSDVLTSRQIGHGPRAAEFEHAVGARIGTPHVAAVNSATSGLQLALRLTPELPGDEVLTTALTFEATNWAILAAGLRPRWVDVDPTTLNMDLADLERKITPATRAIVVVHWAGYPVDLARLREVVDRAEAAHGVRPAVVEDCAHAWGASFRGVPVGNHGNTAVFSFHALKFLTCGEGGLVVLPDAETARRARLLRWFGIDRTADRASADYDVAEWGYKIHLNELGAAIGLANLDDVDGLVARHRDHAAHYDEVLDGVAGLRLTERADDREPSWWVYPVLVEDRPAFLRKMTGAGVAVSAIVRRNDLHSCVREYAAHLPRLDEVHERVAHIPVGWWLSEEDLDRVVSAIRSGW